jgi:hypothetical protein
VAVGGGTGEEDLEGEEETTGIGSSITAISFSKILNSNNSPSQIANKTKVVSLSLHNLMALLLEGCLLLGLSKVHILSFLHSNLVSNPTNGYLQTVMTSIRTIGIKMEKGLLRQKVGWQNRCRRRRVVGVVKYR